MATFRKTAPALRVLRVGVVRCNRVVEERLVPPDTAVTVGEAPSCTFLAPGVRGRWVLFEPRHGAYLLRVPVGARARVASTGKVNDLPAGPMPPTPLALDASSRGKVVLGDATFLFQFVLAPPAPAWARTGARGWADDDDAVWSGFVALFGAMALVLGVYSHQVEPVDVVTIDDLPQHIVEAFFAFPPRTPEKEKAREERVVAREEKREERQAEKQAERTEKRERRAMTAAERRAEEAARRLALEEEVTARSAIIGLITHRGEDRSGQTALDPFAREDGLGQPLQTALDQVGALEFAATGGPALRTSTDGRVDATFGELDHGGARRRDVADVPATTPKARMRAESLGDPPGLTDRPEVERAVRRAVANQEPQIQACYERRLVGDATMAGRLALEIEVAAGRVVDVAITTNTTGDGALEACVIERVRSWRFPVGFSGTIAKAYSLEPG